MEPNLKRGNLREQSGIFLTQRRKDAKKSTNNEGLTWGYIVGAKTQRRSTNIEGLTGSYIIVN